MQRGGKSFHPTEALGPISGWPWAPAATQDKSLPLPDVSADSLSY